jgi:hypothetical protein
MSTTVKRITPAEAADMVAEIARRVVQEDPDATVSVVFHRGVSEIAKGGVVTRVHNGTVTLSLLINGGAQDGRLAHRSASI